MSAGQRDTQRDTLGGLGGPYAADGPGGLPAYRNGERVLSAVAVGDVFVVLVERAGFEYVTATTATGRDGWDGGHYFPFGTPGRGADPATRARCLLQARADLFARVAGWVPGLAAAVEARLTAGAL